MSAAPVKSEGGFGLVELLIAMVVMQVGLLAVVGAFGAGSVALANASHVNTAAVVADEQMELYRAMPYDAIGLDVNATTTSPYTLDSPVCPDGAPTPCENSAPVKNDGSSTWDCSAASGSTSVSLYFTANGVNPCTPQRTVSTAASPDGHAYEVDTYISWAAGSGQRAVKTILVVVRDANNTSRTLAKEVTTFDCSTGAPTNTTC